MKGAEKISPRRIWIFRGALYGTHYTGFVGRPIRGGRHRRTGDAGDESREPEYLQYVGELPGTCLFFQYRRLEAQGVDQERGGVGGARDGHYAGYGTLRSQCGDELGQALSISQGYVRQYPDFVVSGRAMHRLDARR